MASACVDDNTGTTSSAEINFPALVPSCPPYRCLSPRVPASEEECSDDFEFCLEDHPSAMLPADELFSDGKFVPLMVSSTLQSGVTERSSSTPPETGKVSLRMAEMDLEVSGMMDPHNSLFSPKAPRCTTRWRELLGLKNNNKLSSQNAKSSDKTLSSSSSSPSSGNNNKHSSSSALKQYFLHRSSKQSSSSTNSSSSLNLRLLKDLDMSCESLSISSSSSRLSLSSSSSSGGHELENIDLPRLSLDSDKPGPPNPFAPARRIRMAVKPQQPTATTAGEHSSAGTAAADSPRMNPSGKIVFHGLGRSSSSPAAGCNFNNGGSRSRLKSRGMERSYSANVRITPFLNVPVCSLRGSSKNGLLGQLFSSSSSSSSSSPNKNGTGGNNRVRLHSINGLKNRTEINGKVVRI